MSTESERELHALETAQEAFSSSEQEEVARMVAHDLKSPLCSILGFVRLLERDYGPGFDDVGRGYLDHVLANVEHMQRLIEDLLSAGPLRSPLPQRTLVESREVCLQLAADLKPQLDEHGIELLLPSVPPPVYAVRTHLYQVLFNLVSNAIRHMGPVERPWIRVDVRRTDGGVEVLVEDNGRGIAPGLQGSLFDRSFTPQVSNGNGGLGLVIVKRIVEAHDGEVTLVPSSSGARFLATFPDNT